MNYSARPKPVVRRSWLLVPLSNERLLENAWSLGADVVVLDLMELVTEQDKPRARERVQASIANVSRGGAEVFVQVDQELLYADLRACVYPGLTGVVVPGFETAKGVAEADVLISELEDERGLLPGTVQIVAALDTSKGNLAGMEIARASQRLWGLTLGKADLVMDLRPEPSGEFHLMTYLMQRLVIIANAASLVPLGAWWRAPARGLIAGPEDTYEAALRGCHIGFKGCMCIVPEQVEPMNRGFTPSTPEVSSAQDSKNMMMDPSGIEAALDIAGYAKACLARDNEKADAVNRIKQDSEGTGGAP